LFLLSAGVSSFTLPAGITFMLISRSGSLFPEPDGSVLLYHERFGTTT
jgi:hypothetical protein